jgi:hypothetical protein
MQMSIDVGAEATSTPTSAPLSPVLLDCPCISCDKKFVNTTALKYHQNAAHRTFDAVERRSRRAHNDSGGGHNSVSNGGEQMKKF